MKKFFGQIKVWKWDAAGANHLAHVLRVRTRYRTSGDIEVKGDIRILNYVRSGKATCHYLEIMTYGHSDDENRRIVEYLERQFSRPVVPVLHFDESHPHGHWLIPWQHTINGKMKAIRMQRGDFKRILDGVAEALGQEQTPRGQGRISYTLSQYEKNPEAIQKNINKMNHRDAKLMKYVSYLVSIYSTVNIFADNILIQSFSDIAEFNLKQVRKLERLGKAIAYASPKKNNRNQPGNTI